MQFSVVISNGEKKNFIFVEKRIMSVVVIFMKIKGNIYTVAKLLHLSIHVLTIVHTVSHLLFAPLFKSPYF